MLEKQNQKLTKMFWSKIQRSFLLFWHKCRCMVINFFKKCLSNFADDTTLIYDEHFLMVKTRADLGISRGGRIFKKFSKILTIFFFRSTKLIFRALPKHCFAPILAKFSAQQANFWKNSQKSRFWALFEKFWQKNRVFLARAPPQS